MSNVDARGGGDEKRGDAGWSMAEEEAMRVRE